MPAPPVPTFTEATPPQSGFVRASQAPELAAKQRALNGAKRPEFIPPGVRELSNKGQLYIFNVGPKRLEGSGASYGSMQISPCPEGREYSDPLVTPGLPHEYYNLMGNTLSPQFHGDGDIQDPGWDFACQVIGGFTDAQGRFEGKFLTQDNSLEKFGVGISRQWPPAPVDVALAKKKMLARYASLVQEANEAYTLGRFSAVSTDDHWIAARTLGKTAKECRWMEMAADVPETKELCPKCRKPYEVGTVEHDCGFILDMKQYEQWVAEGRIAGTAPPAPVFPGKQG